MSTERWLPVAEFPDYEVSDLGRVRRMTPTLRGGRAAAGRILRQKKHRNSMLVDLWTERRTNRTVMVHRLVARAFHGPCPEGCEVHHIDFDTSNNRASNLTYATHRQNLDYSIDAGRFLSCGTKNHGSANGNSKLTTERVIDIRRRLAAGETHKSIAATEGISASAVYLIGARLRWSHVA